MLESRNSSCYIRRSNKNDAQLMCYVLFLGFFVLTIIVVAYHIAKICTAAETFPIILQPLCTTEHQNHCEKAVRKEETVNIKEYKV